MSERPLLSLSREEDEPEEHDEKTAEQAPAASNELESRLLKLRKVMIFGEITDKLARDVVSRMLALAGEADEPIDVFINSPGGHVESGDTIHDIIRFIRESVPVRIIGTGWVASAGAHIYLAGAKDKRFCLPQRRFLLHQPMGGVRGPAVDIGIEAKEIVKMRERLNKVISEETGQPLEKVAIDTDRNYWMSAEEAISYGMVTKIITSPDQLR